MQAAAKSESWEAAEVLEELLAHSIRLRGLYKNARWQTADIQLRLLRQLFDAHYKEQTRLVDVLVDRIRALNATYRVFAGDFLHRTRFSELLPGRASQVHLLVELVDAHESVLSTVNGLWTRDFAVGQVVLANDEQILAVREQLMNRKRMLWIHPTYDC
jgi:DNA-binding ferritin-like protein